MARFGRCPKCGYNGMNRVTHVGTGEIECEECRHDYVPGEKSSKKEESSYKLKPSSFYFSKPEKRSYVLPRLGEEMVLEHNFIDGFSKRTGIDHENLCRRKTEFDFNNDACFPQVQRSLDTWTDFSHSSIGPMGTAILMSETMGVDCESAYMKLTNPGVYGYYK